MEVKNLSDLGKIMDLCRKKGIDSIKISENGIEFKLSEEIPKSNYKKKQEQGRDTPDVQTTYTDEDLIDWSSAQAFEGQN